MEPMIISNASSVPPWAHDLLYREDGETSGYPDPSAASFSSSLPTDSGAFWSHAMPQSLPWASSVYQGGACHMADPQHYHDSYLGVPSPAPLSPRHSFSEDMTPSEDESCYSTSPSMSRNAFHDSHTSLNELYPPASEAEYFHDLGYLQAPPPAHQPWTSHPMDEQLLTTPMADAQHPPFNPYHGRGTYEVRNAAPLRPPFPSLNRTASQEPPSYHRRSTGGGHSRSSSASSINSVTSTSSAPASSLTVAPRKITELARPHKVVKPRTKTRARPARWGIRSTRGGSVSSASGSDGQCPHCPQVLKHRTALQKHITVAHTRPFSCVFSLYGCTSTFGSKNEWKRHVSSQHLRLGIWRCDLEGCQPHDLLDGEEGMYNDFNRKDLFSQHLRRMHTPAHLAHASDKAALNAWLADTCKRCLVDLRQPPPRAECGFCGAVFEGSQAWELRMEHVGRHMEGAHADESAWREDLGLRDWMIREGLLEQDAHGRWVLASTAPGSVAFVPSKSVLR